MRIRPIAWWLAAAIAPAIAFGTSLVHNAEPRVWLRLSRPLAQAVAGDAILYSASALVVIAPLVGVAVVARRRAPNDADGMLLSPTVRARASIRRDTSAVVGGLAVFVTVSALLFIFALGITPDAVMFVATLHATLASAALALFALGGFCAAWLRHPLDAAGCALTAALISTAGVLVAGAPVADAPRALVNAALIASPLVGIASAARIDIVRMDVLYRLSPLAHIGFDYPEWYTTSACYLLAAAVCAAAVKARIKLSDALPIP